MNQEQETPIVSPPPLNDNQQVTQSPLGDTEKPRSKKKLVWILSLLGVLIIAAISTFFIVTSSLRAQANESAKEYKQSVFSYLDLFYDTEKTKTAAAQLEMLKKPVGDLKSVTYGKELSEDYKKAIELQDRYKKLIADAIPPYEEYIAMSEFKPTLQKYVNALNLKVSITPITTSLDDAQIAALRKEAQGLQEKAKAYASVAQEFASLKTPSDIRDDLQAARSGLEKMSATYAVIAGEYEKVLSSKSGVNSEELNRTISKATQSYSQDTKDVTNALSRAVNTINSKKLYTTTKDEFNKSSYAIGDLYEELKK